MHLSYDQSAAIIRVGRVNVFTIWTPVVIDCEPTGVTRTATKRTAWTSWAGVVGFCVGAVCTVKTGLVAALPSAMGLTVLAATDMSARRIPKRILAATAMGTIACGVADSLRQGSAERFTMALLTAAIVGAIAGATWCVTAGIAFGDVKLLALAAFVPAFLRGTAVITMVVVSLLVATAMIVIERIRLGSLALKSTIPFGPPLLVGWLVGVWIA